jgi:hypothetical protein
LQSFNDGPDVFRIDSINKLAYFQVTMPIGGASHGVAKGSDDRIGGRKISVWQVRALIVRVRSRASGQGRSRTGRA